MQKTLQLSKKIVLLGDPSVGKTSVARKFVFDMFDDKYISTLGTKITKKEIAYENISNEYRISLTLLVWDVMGQHDFEKFHEVAFTGCKGGIIVCDITRNETIENWQFWQKSLYKTEGEMPIIIIANKNDLANEHQLGVDLFKNIASEFNVPSFFTSAKSGENIESAFYILGEKLLEIDFPK